MSAGDSHAAGPTSEIDELKPAVLWRRFRELSAAPRPPRFEQAAVALIRDWAGRLGFAAVPAGGSNLLVRAPATQGREGAPLLVLQAHLDMVCERDPWSALDPATDGVRLLRDGEWVTADGTTLGADDGIGVAALQAVAEGEDPHGPLELLFTTAEEAGLEGAGLLDGEAVTGRRLLNLDAQEDGVLIIGCAGATDSTLRAGGEREPVDPSTLALRVSVSGALGGHSGLDISAGRANALTVLGRCLGETIRESPFRLASLDGGRSRNAIPREAFAVVTPPPGGGAPLRAALEASGREAVAAFAGTEPDLVVTVEETAVPPAAWPTGTTRRLVDVLRAVPSGPLALDPRLPGVVETSTSLGLATTRGDTLELHSLTRTSNPAALGDVLGTLAAVAGLADGELTVEHGYPAWQPRPESPLVAACVTVWRDLFGREPVVTAAHAGLEPALLGRTVPGLDMVSIGPLIESPHSPRERLSIPSVERFWRFLTAALDVLSA